MIQGTPCLIHGKDEVFTSVLYSVNQYTDQFGSYPVAVIRSMENRMITVKISCVEVEYPQGTPCRIIGGGADYMSTYIGIYDFNDGEKAYPVAVVRDKLKRLRAVSVQSVHFLDSEYLFDRKEKK